MLVAKRNRGCGVQREINIQAFYVYAFDYLRDNREDLEYILHTIEAEGVLSGETHLLSKQISSNWGLERVTPTWQRLSIMDTYSEYRTSFNDKGNNYE